MPRPGLALLPAMSGEVNVESALGEGAKFTVVLPVTVVIPAEAICAHPAGAAA